MFDYEQKVNPHQKCLTKTQYLQLVHNHDINQNNPFPVVKFFTTSGATWLLTELEPVSGIAFGLADLGQGFPELGSISLVEFCSRGAKFPWVERDLHFKPTKTLREYADEAREKGTIVC